MRIWVGDIMKIPNIFKETIKNIFYDKKIEIWTCGELTDDEGATIGDGKETKIEELLGNFQFSTREYIQQEYGKEIEASAIITCETTIAEIGNILVYNNEDYMIKSVIKSDSHFTILVERNDVNV